MVYPDESKELTDLLDEDQKEYKKFAKKYLLSNNKSSLEKERLVLVKHFRERAKKMRRIVKKIGLPSISNIGKEANIAVSVLASHASIEDTKFILDIFNKIYKKNKEEVNFESIAALSDIVLVFEHKPQEYGTIWFFDNNLQPFLPTIRNPKELNERREKYGLGPLRWPKSLALDESLQPWLKKPINELIMREPTKKEYLDNFKNYI